ncbi:MAG: CHAT domain-containing protein [Oculatellaceae cyanobacterium Prado106]|jgi:hypothetical protein|nr:CHAT domain-containing protein [Oculatellaceae cyanobacterium Prado106]
MTEHQSPWGRVFFIAPFSKSAGVSNDLHDIESELERTKFPSEPVYRGYATDTDDIREEINRAAKEKNSIVHFSGHGDENGFILEKDGKEEFLSSSELARFFASTGDNVKNIRCVIFNFCDSSQFAAEAAKQVEYAIGVTGTIESKAASDFSQGFYHHLSDKKPDDPNVFHDAFAAGKNSTVGDDPQKYEIFISNELNVEMNKPEAGSSIPSQCQFSGTFRNLPENSTMWLYVRGTVEGKYYLVEIMSYSTDNRKWEITVPVGDEQGGNFQIGVIVVDDKVAEHLRKTPPGTGHPDLPAFVGKRFGERSVQRSQSI